MRRHFVASALAVAALTLSPVLFAPAPAGAQGRQGGRGGGAEVVRGAAAAAVARRRLLRTDRTRTSTSMAGTRSRNRSRHPGRSPDLDRKSTRSEERRVGKEGRS